MTEATPPRATRQSATPAFLFDLDGTLVDSVYQHVLSWHDALAAMGIPLSVWRIHRRIGMSGGLFANALLREMGHEITEEMRDRLRQGHAEAFAKRVGDVRPLPGARELLAALTELNVPWAIATSGHMRSAAPSISMLGVDPGKAMVVTRDQVRYAKPDPDLFLTAAERIGVSIFDSIVVGDSICLLSGGYGEDELVKAGAYRVYEDPADLLRHLDEVGVRRAG
jgi:beta-phosphoglucomutase-like phosphatase (HAD superfamily)